MFSVIGELEFVLEYFFVVPLRFFPHYFRQRLITEYAEKMDALDERINVLSENSTKQCRQPLTPVNRSLTSSAFDDVNGTRSRQQPSLITSVIEESMENALPKSNINNNAIVSTLERPSTDQFDLQKHQSRHNYSVEKAPLKDSTGNSNDVGDASVGDELGRLHVLQRRFRERNIRSNRPVDQMTPILCPLTKNRPAVCFFALILHHPILIAALFLINQNLQYYNCDIRPAKESFGDIVCNQGE